jgi:hypothetical protein
MAIGDGQRRSKAFQNSVQAMTVERYLDRLKGVGWFEGRSERATQALAVRVRKAFADKASHAFYALADTSFDAECIEATGPDEECSYHSVLMQLAEVSRGGFRPENLREEVDFEEGIARVSFELDGESFEREFEQEDDWFSPEALELVNDALESVGRDERFIPLPPCDQTLSVCFITQDTYDAAVDIGLIPDAEMYALEDEPSVDV